MNSEPPKTHPRPRSCQAGAVGARHCREGGRPCRGRARTALPLPPGPPDGCSQDEQDCMPGRPGQKLQAVCVTGKARPQPAPRLLYGESLP